MLNARENSEWRQDSPPDVNCKLKSCWYIIAWNSQMLRGSLNPGEKNSDIFLNYITRILNLMLTQTKQKQSQ